MIAAECEPWAKTGGLGDVVDALARALGRIAAGLDAPVDVFLPRYRAMTLPDGEHPRRRIRVPDPVSPIGSTEVTVVDVVSHGYRLRLVDHPPAFDRAGYYGEPSGGDYPDNAWRFGLLCRSALEMLRADGRPVDVIHLHDWHAAPAVVLRDRFYRDDPIVGQAAALLTIHNLAYHGWVPRDRLRELGLAPGDPLAAADPAGMDLLRVGDRAVRDREHGEPRLRRRGAHPGVRDGPRHDPPAQGGPVRSGRRVPLRRDPQRARHRAVEPGDGLRPRQPATRPATWPARPPAGPTCSPATGWTRTMRGRSSG